MSRDTNTPARPQRWIALLEGPTAKTAEPVILVRIDSPDSIAAFLEESDALAEREAQQLVGLPES